MADVLREFLVSIGFAADASQAKSVEATVAKTEAKITATQAAETAKRTATEEKASDARVTIAEALTRLLNLEEQKLSDAREKARKVDTERDKKAAEDQAKKAQERREAAVKSMQVGALKLAAFAAKAIAAVEGAALGIVFAADKAGKAMERLNYSAQMMGASAKGVNAIEYSISQLGGSIEGAHTSLKNFGDRMRLAPEGTIALLDSLHVQTRDAQGNILATDKLWTGLMDNLAKRPYREGMLRAGGIGTDESTFRAATNPRFAALEAEQRRIHGSIGSDADDAAKSGTAFEQSLRKLEEVITAIKTKVETGVFKVLQPELERLSTWAEANGGHIADVLGRIVRDIIRLASAVMNRLAKLDWDGILTKAEAFVAGVDKAMTGAFGEKGTTIVALTAFAALVTSKVLGPLNLVLDALKAISGLPLLGRLLGGATLLNPAVLGTAAVGAVLASGDPNKALLSGGHPDVQPQDNDLGLPATGQPDADRPSDTSRPQKAAGGVWDWIKRNAPVDFGKAGATLRSWGFGDKLPSGDDRRVKDAILSTAENTKKLVEKADGGGGAASFGEVSSPTGGLGGSGQHAAGGGSAAGASLRDHALSPRSVYSGKGDIGRQKAGTLANGDESMKFWLSKGLSPDAAAGLVGMEQGEALYDPSNKTGDGGQAHGSFQWHADRRRNIRAATGIDIDTATHAQQLEAAYWEFTQSKDGQARQAWKQITQSGVTAPQSAAIGTTLFERPLNKDSESLLRGRYAQGWLKRHREQGATAMTPTPSGTPAAAITDAEVFAARQRLAAGGRDPKDIAIRDRYLKEQNTPKASDAKPAKVEVVKPVPGFTELHKAIHHYAANGSGLSLRHPIGVTPAMHAAIDNSRRRGDSHFAKTENYHFHGGDGRQMLAEARRTAGRGNADLIRNLQTAEV